jgi:hypothetical protein
MEATRIYKAKHQRDLHICKTMVENISLKKNLLLGMVVHIGNPCTQEAKVGGS